MSPELNREKEEFKALFLYNTFGVSKPDLHLRNVEQKLIDAAFEAGVASCVRIIKDNGGDILDQEDPAGELLKIIYGD